MTNPGAHAGLLIPKLSNMTPAGDPISDVEIRHMTDKEQCEDYWANHPYDAAIQIVKDGFGDHFVDEAARILDSGGYHVRMVFVSEECDVAQYDAAIKEELDKIEWQMITEFLLDSSRFRSMAKPDNDPTNKPQLNIYGVAPISHLKPRPSIAYHATEESVARKIRTEGLKPNWGNVKYIDTEGKIHVCGRLLGDRECSTYWAKLLSENQGLREEDYSILEINLDAVPTARVHRDLHGVSGIVVDHIPVIPARAIVKDLGFIDGAWRERH